MKTITYRLRYDSGIDPFYYSGEVHQNVGTAKILKMPDGSQVTITIESVEEAEQKE